MSTAPATTIKPPIVSKDGNHFETHGKTVYHAPTWNSPEARATAAQVVVYSRGDEKKACEVLLCINREPFHTSFYMEPDDADVLADALRMAAQHARAVRAIKAQRATAKAGEVKA